ncbi:hypothetical protein Hamer_G008835 [Homarus americanus]|uniref:Uncharacterized protein n=1 Tax=Homarus americanus TaxID=6706 RepID=A0A8J5JME2_HOMAM|nr:hypothetical protein Hamer_G008835 [Homarus americanus]
MLADTPESDDCVDLRDEVAGEDDKEASVGFVGMRARPVSSFVQPATNGEVTTPMLYAPGWQDKTESPPGVARNSDNSSDSSIQGEWQTPS